MDEDEVLGNEEEEDAVEEDDLDGDEEADEVAGDTTT
jgi:hypothetical protein